MMMKKKSTKTRIHKNEEHRQEMLRNLIDVLKEEAKSENIHKAEAATRKIEKLIRDELNRSGLF